MTRPWVFPWLALHREVQSPLYILLYAGRTLGSQERVGIWKVKGKNMGRQELCMRWLMKKRFYGIGSGYLLSVGHNLEPRGGDGLWLGVNSKRWWQKILARYGGATVRDVRPPAALARQTHARQVLPSQPCPRETSMWFACWGPWFAQSFQVSVSRH